MHYFVPCPKQGKYFRIFFVLNRVRISNPQQLTYSQIWLSPPPPHPPLFHWSFNLGYAHCLGLQPGASGFCYRASDVCSSLAGQASAVF